MDSSTDISVSQVNVFYYLNREFVFVDLTNCLTPNFSCSQRTHRGTQRRFPPKCIENTAIQSTFRSLQMHSKPRQEIYFAENFRCNLKFYVFLIPLSLEFWNPKICGFFFLPKKRTAYLGSEMRKIKLREIVGNL